MVSFGTEGSLCMKYRLFLWGNMDFIIEGVVPDLLHIISVGTIMLVIEGDCTDNILGKEVEEKSWFWEVGGGGGGSDGHCFVGGGGGGLYSVFYTPFFQTLENTGAICGDVYSHSPACKILLEYF